MARRSTPRRKPDSKPSPPGRPVWTGQLRLALVSVPVRFYSATKSGARLSFHQVHGPSGKRIRYEKVVPGIGPVERDDILKGYEISKGRYVLMTEKEIDAVKLEAKKTFDLVQFVDHCEVDPIYFDKPYYVTPDGELAEDAYRVLRDALRKTRKMGLGQIVMRGREYIGALKPCGDGLLMETLRFADEVREAAPLFADISQAKPDRELLELAEELIGRKAAPFDASNFRDRYTDALRELVETKAKKKKSVEVDEEETGRPRGAEVISLVDALKQSVRRGERPAGKTAGSSKSTATSRRRKAS